jgi:hypothetical protein
MPNSCDCSAPPRNRARQKELLASEGRKRYNAGFVAAEAIEIVLFKNPLTLVAGVPSQERTPF